VIGIPQKLSDEGGGDLSIVWPSVNSLNFYTCMFVTLPQKFRKTGKYLQFLKQTTISQKSFKFGYD